MSPRGTSLWYLALLAAVLMVAGTLAPGPLMWGVHHYAFLPAWTWGLAGFLLLSVFLPGPRDALARAMVRASSGLGDSSRARTAAGVTLLAALTLFWLGREKAYFLSDGELLLRDIQRGVLSSFEADTLSAPFHLWFNQILKSLVGLESWTASFRIAGLAAGAVWVVAILAVVGRLTDQGPGRFFLAGLLLTAGVTRLFYGYVETSPMVAAAVAVYLWAVIRCLDGARRGIPVMTAAFTLAVAMHVTAFLFFPSFLYVLWRRSGTERGRLPAAALAAATPLLALPLFLLIRGNSSRASGAFSEYMSKFVPLSEPLLPKQSYTLFSPVHIAEFLNEQFLLGPFGLFGLIAVLVARRRGPAAAPDPGGPRIAGLETFLLLMAVPILLLSFVYNRELGGARDWDLMANAAVPCLLLVGLKLLGEDGVSGSRGARKNSPAPNPGSLARIAVVMLGVSAVHLAGWVLIDTNPERSLRHIQVLFGPTAPVSRFARAYAQEEMGRYHLERGDYERARESFEQALAIDPADVKAVGPLAHLHTMAGNREKAAFYYGEAARLRPDMAATHQKLALALIDLGRTREAVDAYRECLRLDPDQPGVWQDLGNLLYGLPDYDGARSAYAEALRRKPGDPDLGFNVGLASEALGDSKKALAAYRDVLDGAPDHAPTLFGIATLLLRLGRAEESVHYYTELLVREPGARDPSINLAIASAQLGRLGEAGAALEKIATFDEKTVAAYMDVAKIAASRGKISEAIFLLTACRMRDAQLADRLGVNEMMIRLSR